MRVAKRGVMAGLFVAAIAVTSTIGTAGSATAAKPSPPSATVAFAGNVALAHDRASAAIPLVVTCPAGAHIELTGSIYQLLSPVRQFAFYASPKRIKARCTGATQYLSVVVTQTPPTSEFQTEFLSATTAESFQWVPTTKTVEYEVKFRGQVATGALTHENTTLIDQLAS